MTKTGLGLIAIVALGSQSLAQDSGLDADAEAGKLLFEATTNKGGCIRCHGPEGLGFEEDKTLAGSNIQGKSADDIRLAIMALPMMWNIKLSDPETDQVADYLQYLLDASD